MNKLLRFLIEKFRSNPFPNFITNSFLMIRWRCYIHLAADVRYPFNVQIGPYCRIGKCKISAKPDQLDPRRKTIIIKSRCMIGDGVVLASQGGYIEVGDHTTIHDYSIVYGFGGVVVGDDTRIAAACVIVSHEHIFSDPSKKIREVSCVGKNIKIGKDCWIGAGARILGGVQIGDRAIVGAGAVVTQDVTKEVVVAGVPAKPISSRFGGKI